MYTAGSSSRLYRQYKLLEYDKCINTREYCDVYNLKYCWRQLGRLLCSCWLTKRVFGSVRCAVLCRSHADSASSPLPPLPPRPASATPADAHNGHASSVCTYTYIQLVGFIIYLRKKHWSLIYEFIDESMFSMRAATSFLRQFFCRVETKQPPYSYDNYYL